MDGVQAAALLGSFLAESADRISRRASRALKHELVHGLSWQQRRRAVPSYVQELGALLLERGEAAPRLWGEMVRPYGASCFEARRDVGDLVREFRVLEETIIEEWDRRMGPMNRSVLHLLTTCICEGTSAAVAGYVHRLRTERVEFRESALIETILSYLDEGILLIEADGTFSYATLPAYELFGSELHDALGQSLTDLTMEQLLRRLHARTLDDTPLRPKDLAPLETLRAGKSPGASFIRIHEGDSERILEVTALPIWQEGGAGEGRRDLRGAIVTVRDRTESYRKSESLRRANTELAELHARLLHRSRSQAMGELASGAAHALNNLLNAMNLRLRLLRESPTSEQIDALERSIGDIANLVSRLQDFAAQRPAGAAGPTDLDAVVSEALALARPEGQRTGEGEVRLVTDLKAPPPILANTTALREILVSLMLYAHEQLAAGGELRIATEALSEGGARFALAYRTSAGAPPRAEAWFEPFLGAEAPASVALVTASARDAVTQWGGALDARSLPDGAEFILTFAPVATKAPRPEPLIMTTETTHRTVLVVDDDPDNATMLAEVLAAEGHDTDMATTGKEALAKWREREFDVALVDLLMPDMSGTQIAAELLKVRPGARIALVTGWELDAEQRRAAPVHAIFHKPVDLMQLLAFLGPVAQEPAPAP
ncbi:MAG: response regulator [Myxococcales bacterium]